jgi:hypothetical protein
MTETLKDVIDRMTGTTLRMQERNIRKKPGEPEEGFTPLQMLTFMHEVEAALMPLLGIDLSKVLPVPWTSKAESYPFADTGDYVGRCFVVDGDDNAVLDGDDDPPDEKSVEIGDVSHNAYCVAAAACVNAVAELQEAFGKLGLSETKERKNGEQVE